MIKDPARAYRESAVRGASPVGLIVILYEEIIRSIRRAQRAVTAGKIEERSNALTHALEVIGHLQGVIKFDQGGTLAQELVTFYTLTRAKLLEANVKPQDKLLEDLAGEFAKMKEAWQRVDSDLSAQRTESGSHPDVPELVVSQKIHADPDLLRLPMERP